MKPPILVIDGPGPGDFVNDHGNDGGGSTLSAVREACEALAAELGLHLEFRQAEDNEEMVRWMSSETGAFDAIIINPGDYSEAARELSESYRPVVEAIARLDKPVIEVHLQNIYKQRVEVSRSSHQAVGDIGFICGLGKDGYLLAIRAMAKKLEIKQMPQHA